MSFEFQRPLTAAERKILADKLKPSQEEQAAAQDQLFLNILLRLNELEDKQKEQPS